MGRRGLGKLARYWKTKTKNYFGQLFELTFSALNKETLAFGTCISIEIFKLKKKLKNQNLENMLRGIIRKDGKNTHGNLNWNGKTFI